TRDLLWLSQRLAWAGDPDAAVALLRKVRRQHPGDFLVNEALARCLAQLKPPPWDEVIEFRTAALALRPKSASAHAALGDALRQKGRIGAAIASAREALRLDPSNPRAHRALGWTHLSNGEFEKAELEFREV